ncbi:NucA/NucB deoxyribonuclease domain-containing protein [Stenotrophomonas rhizophila]
MKLTPLALAVALFALPAYAQDEEGCPTDAEMVASMTLDELRQYEHSLQNPEMSFEEACKDATDKDEEEATGSRMHYCVKRTAIYSSANPETGTTESANVTLYDYVSVQQKGLRWNHRLRVVFEAVEGNAMAGLIVAPEIFCGSCTEKQQLEPQTLAGPGTYDFAVAMGFDTDDGRVEEEVQLVLSRFNTDQSLLQASAPSLRCDKISKKDSSGCRYSGYPAVFDVSLSDPETDESATHIKVAQEILPGMVGRWHEDAAIRGKALTRSRDSEVRKDNRKEAGRLCAARFPDLVGTGLNCDEYPFAATNQGASLVPEAAMSVKFIAGADNQKVGRRLGTFLCNNARVIDGEEFWVKVVD